MRDEDDADARRLEIGDDLEEPVRLGDGEARRRLVHDDDAGIERQRLGDLDELALGEREVGDGVSGLKSTPSRSSSGCDRRAQAGAVDEPQRTAAATARGR